MAGQAPQSVATGIFRNMNSNSIVNQNIDWNECFFRAMKVFCVSYAGMDRLDAALYQRKLTEYVREVADLYDIVPVPDQSYWEGIVLTELRNEQIEIRVGIKRYKYSNRANTRSRVNINNGIDNQITKKVLSVMSEVQHMSPYSKAISFATWTQIRLRGAITITFEPENLTPDMGELAEFQLPYAQLHAEGFEDWFEFGRDIKLLIKIDFIAVESQESMPSLHAAHLKFVSEFHYHSIINMISKRLSVYRQSQRMEGIVHKHTVHKKKLTYIQSRIDPRSDEAYWEYPPTGLVESIQRLSITQTEEEYRNSMRRTKKIKFCDIQIGFDFNDEFEDSFCLCNEWCNWNAFFHYNPIYRFILVQHNQLYIKNKTNIADMYAFGCIYQLGQTCILAPLNQPMPKTPLFRLLSAANEYQEKIFYIRLRKPNVDIKYFVSVPQPVVFNAVEYNLLRYDFRYEIFSQTLNIPFSDDNIENIKLYYKLLSELHIKLAIPGYVPNDLLTDWLEELDTISRIQYNSYLTNSYTSVITTLQHYTDYLFTEDYEYSNIHRMTDIQEYGKSIRDNVWKYGRRINQLNIKCFCGPVISALILINKFIQSIEPSLPKLHAPESLRSIYDFCFQMDTNFLNYKTQNINSFAIDANDLNAINLQQFRRNFIIFYTLKIYFVMFSVQKYCVYSLIEYNKEANRGGPLQVCQIFEFIWFNDFIESTYVQEFNESLYETNTTIEDTFREFYENFWGRADHEINVLPDYTSYIISAYCEYERLWFWWANNGDNTLIFLRFLNSLEENLGYIENRTQNIFRLYIATPSQTLIEFGFIYAIEVIDTLVYYLMKATCFMIVRTVGIFLKQVHTLQIPPLVANRVHFTLTKPGWVPIFRTMRLIFEHLNHLRTQYIAFDDEFNRISKAFTQTKQLIKKVYSDFYMKLIRNFGNEFIFAANQVIAVQDIGFQFLCLHLCVGISFLAVFVDDCREYSQHIRKTLNRMYEQFVLNPNLTQCQTGFTTSWPLCLNYLSEPNEIEVAIPFQSHIWINGLDPQIVDDMNQLIAADVNIDLQVANT